MLSWLTEHGIEVVAAIAGIVAAITGALVLRAGRRIVRVEVMGFRPGQKEWGELQGPQPFLFVKFTAQRNPVRIASGALVARGGHRLQGYGVGLDRQAHENLPEGGDFILTWALTDARPFVAMHGGPYRACWFDSEGKRRDCKGLEDDIARELASVLTPAEGRASSA